MSTPDHGAPRPVSPGMRAHERRQSEDRGQDRHYPKNTKAVDYHSQNARVGNML